MLTVDFFPPIVDDPFTYGAIAAANALSDVYAMGGRPVTALNIAGMPRSLPHEVFAKILEGGAQKAIEAGVTVLGGHTVRDDEPKYGMAVTGLIHPDEIIPNSAAERGDLVILTKPIGTGIISTALKNDLAPQATLARAVESMSTLNKSAGDAMLEVGARSATDVTGYGLLGHLREMALGSGLSATVSRSAVPVIEGALELLGKGIAPGGTRDNLTGLEPYISWANALDEDDKLLLCDAQTSGGLLIAISPERADELLAALRERKTLASSVIGEFVEGPAGEVSVAG